MHRWKHFRGGAGFSFPLANIFHNLLGIDHQHSLVQESDAPHSNRQVIGLEKEPVGVSLIALSTKLSFSSVRTPFLLCHDRLWLIPLTGTVLGSRIQGTQTYD
jgi:hypothetical protein